MTGSPEIDVLQLKKVGEGVTMRVTKCGPMAIGQFPEISFVGVLANGQAVEVRVPQKSADRQLERLDLTYDMVVGQTVTIGRSANASVPTRPFWDVDIADTPIDAPQRIAPTAPTASAATPPANGNGNGNGNGAGVATTAQREKASELYKNITKFALDQIAPLYQAHKLELHASDIKEMVATIFINATSHR